MKTRKRKTTLAPAPGRDPAVVGNSLSSRTVRSTLVPLANHFVRVCFRLWARFAPAAEMHGIRIINLESPTAQSTLIARMAEVIELIARYDPQRLQQIRRYAPTIVLVPTGGSGEYWYKTRAFGLDTKLIDSGDTPLIAMTAIHEATHARLEQMGVSNDPANTARVERICTRAEVDFATKVPDGSRYIPALNHRLAQEWWSDEATFARNTRRLLSPGFPRWMLKLHHWLFRAG